jgi:hypothetical protein
MNHLRLLQCSIGSNIGPCLVISQSFFDPLCVTAITAVITVTGSATPLEALYFVDRSRSEARMKTLPEVETAKQLMNEAMRWSVMTWLREKKRVRKTADQANAALDRVSEELRQRWPGDIKNAYNALGGDKARTGPNGRTGQKAQVRDSKEFVIAGQLKDADEEAYRARMAAEKTFDDAEKRLSTSLAREGCHKAILSWELHESAIRQSEKLCS